MTPRKIFGFGIIIIALIVIISVIFPADGWRVGGYTLYFPDYRTWFKPKVTEYKDIHDIISFADIEVSDLEIAIPVDSISVSDSTITERTDVERNHPPVDSILGYTYPFEFPEGNDTLLYPLFRKIDRANRQNKPLRILHYGDSQIESDHITSTIRNFMQKKYGGMGMGFIPIVPVTDASVTFQQDLSPNWKRFSLLDKKNDTLSVHRRFGITGNFFRYLSAGVNDTTAVIGLSPIYFGYRNARSFTHARLFYGASGNDFTVIINQADTQRLAARNIISSAWWKFEKAQTALHLTLQSSALPDLYGIALDGAHGVAVDNIPMRGSAGLDFSRMDTAQMGQMFRMTGVEMLILQFGANIVPHMVDNYDYYARSFARQLNLLQALKPGIVILVIGVNDMSRNTAQGYTSYPNIAKIRDAQKQAAFETGCVFWDLFEAMGGENSMPSWVMNDPPLAQTDFVHFNYRGARIIAELFCRAWEKEYVQVK